VKHGEQLVKITFYECAEGARIYFFPQEKIILPLRLFYSALFSALKKKYACDYTHLSLDKKNPGF